MSHRKSILNISLGKEKVLNYYRGASTRVTAKDNHGKTVNLPFSLLLDYVTHEGVSGLFEIEYEEDGSLVSIRKIG